MVLLGAQRIPDQTTVGNYLRRPIGADIEKLMDDVNKVRLDLWRTRPKPFRRRATIDVDGTIVPTPGEKKAGMGMRGFETRSRCPVERARLAGGLGAGIFGSVAQAWVYNSMPAGSWGGMAVVSGAGAGAVSGSQMPTGPS